MHITYCPNSIFLGFPEKHFYLDKELNASSVICVENFVCGLLFDLP